jgi:anti-sigma regulatory factor (Ser/Thr protein kinase)
MKAGSRTPIGKAQAMTTKYCLAGGLDSVGSARREVLRGCAWDVRQLDVIRLMLSELITNAVIHGGVGPDAELRIDRVLDDATVTFRVYDRGDGFAQPDFERPQGDRGFGLFLVDRLARRWGVTPAPGGSSVWFEALIDDGDGHA